VHATGCPRGLEVSGGGTGVVSHAGLVLLRLLADRPGLTSGASAALPRPPRCGALWQDTGLVFTTRKGTPIEPRNFTRSFDRLIARASVRRITVHGTRKTCGTLLAALDVHPRVAMQILRHSQIKVTMEIYRGYVRGHQRRSQAPGRRARGADGG
jgi:integrase